VFIREAREQGPTTLRIKYPYPEIPVMIALAKDLSIIAGHNEINLISPDILKNPEEKLTKWIQGKDFLIIASNAIAYQNSGGMIRGSAEQFVSPMSMLKLKPHAKEIKYYNKYVFEYLWRSLGRYSKQKEKVLGQPGPIDHFIQAYLEANPKGSSKDCYMLLNDECGFSKYLDIAQLSSDVGRCDVFQAAWGRRTSQ